MPTLDLFTPDNWIRATLLATGGATTVINGETVSADAVAFCSNRIVPEKDGYQPAAWPYIMFGPARPAAFDNYAQQNTLLDGEYLIRAVMREDLLGPTDVLEGFNRAGYLAIATAFQGVKQSGGATGVIHACQVLRPHNRTYGEVGKRINEMGVVARIFST